MQTNLHANQRASDPVNGQPVSGDPISGVTSGDNPSDQTRKFATLVCYLVGPLVWAAQPQFKRDRLVRFHGFQALFTHCAILLAGAVCACLGVGITTFLAELGLTVFLICKTYSGEKLVLPFVGSLAERQAERETQVPQDSSR